MMRMLTGSDGGAGGGGGGGLNQPKVRACSPPVTSASAKKLISLRNDKICIDNTCDSD